MFKVYIPIAFLRCFIMCAKLGGLRLIFIVFATLHESVGRENIAVS